ncbi:MAG: hypothetical protein ACOYYJ_07930 [Chloroflexota bacterium]
MADQSDLEKLYREAQTALKAKDFAHASDLLREILKINVDYKDAAQLLARVIQLSRRRWYNDPRTWGALGAILLVGLGIYLFPILRDLYRQPAPAPVILPSSTPAQAVDLPATVTLLPMPTSIPLTWKRVSIGQEFERDTVTAFATDKKDPDVIYAGMKNAGVYKTIDGGLSWRPAHYGLSNTQVESLVIDSKNTRILYAGTMGGVFKTEDGGENWRKIGNGTHLLIDWQDSSHIYARDENGIYETTDQGNHWLTSYNLNRDCPKTVSSWAIHPADGKSLFIGEGGECEVGIYQSNDSGHSWRLIEIDGIFGVGPIIVGLDEQGNHFIHAQVFSNPGGLYTSHDDGASGNILSEGNFGCDILASDPSNPSTTYCASRRLYVSPQKGAAWQEIPGTYSIIYTAIHIDHPNGANRIIAGGIDVSTTSDPSVGIFTSDDGSSWTQQDNGLGLTRTEIKIDPMDSARIYLATYFGEFEHRTGSFAKCLLYRSQDKAKSWSLIKWRGGDWCGPTFDATHVLYLIENNSLQKSFDAGETWLWDLEGKLLSSGRLIDENAGYRLPDWDIGATYQSVSANPYIDGLIYAVGDEIYYSPDLGVSWQKSAGNEGSWDARLFYTDQSKTIYSIGRYHQTYSTDNGVTWQACGQDVTASRSDTRLALDLQGSRLYLATPGQGVLVSADTCGSWQPSNNGLTNLFVNTLALDPNNPDIVYAGTDGGAYISYDAGATWGQVNDGLLGATVVYSIAVDKDSNVYAATPYGIFTLDGK